MPFCMIIYSNVNGVLSKFKKAKIVKILLHHETYTTLVSVVQESISMFKR